MTDFGWSYPPGCSGPPGDDYDETCPVCGAKDIDRCVCPTCRQCGCAGDPECYHELARKPEFGHRHMTAEQHRARHKAELAARQEAEHWEALARMIDDDTEYHDTE